MPNSLDNYRLLGRSGLRVSPIALGTMTFGEPRAWGADEPEARRIFDTYVDMGGNFIDTANNYGAGASETLVGTFAKQKRDSLVVATKYSITADPKDPNAGGNHRKNMVQSVEQSLKRLQMDSIDILYLHMWDFTTPVEEILRAMDDLVRAGKILYVGLSDTPAWQASRMQAIADLRGWSPITVIQIEYSLAERTGERDLLPMAHEMGMGVVAWAPLGSGVLTGKYKRERLAGDRADAPSGADSREDIALATGALSVRALDIADEVTSVAAEIDATPAQVALAWVLSNPTMSAPIVGARTQGQIVDNLDALGISLDDSLLARLASASQIGLGFPHELLAKPMADALLFGELSRVSHRR